MSISWIFEFLDLAAKVKELKFTQWQINERYESIDSLSKGPRWMTFMFNGSDGAASG
jgi:hypothetical protein